MFLNLLVAYGKLWFESLWPFGEWQWSRKIYNHLVTRIPGFGRMWTVWSSGLVGCHESCVQPHPVTNETPNWWLLFVNSSWWFPFTPSSVVYVGGSWQYERLTRVWILGINFTCKILWIWAWLSPGSLTALALYIALYELRRAAWHSVLEMLGRFGVALQPECNAYGKVI